MPHPATLLHWGLKGKQRPAQEQAYRALVHRYLDDPPFRHLVKDISLGLGLRILAAGELGLVLAAEPDSAFAFRHMDFRGTNAKADDRILDGLIQLAIAATVFPRARDLEEEATLARPAITVGDVEDLLRRLCDRLADQAKGEADPVAGDMAGVYEAWREYRGRHDRKEALAWPG